MTNIEILYNAMPKELQTKYLWHVLNMAYLQGQLDYIEEQFNRHQKEGEDNGQKLFLEQKKQ